MSLHTSVGSIQLRTPLLLASGYITETPEFFLKAKPLGCAGMVTRSLKEFVPPERRQIPAPRYAVFDQNSMLACEWGNERPWTDWRDFGVSQVQATGSPIIISLSGRDADSCCNLMEVFDTMGVDAYEINISCPHSGMLHGNLNTDETYLRQLLTRLRAHTTTPLWVKLSYSSIMLRMALQAEAYGANAIVCTNTIGPGMLIDTATAKAKLGSKHGVGGVAGKAIFPIALSCVYQLAIALRIPVVGCGGIFTADNVIQMLMAGASAVQLYTAPALKGPAVFKRISFGLEEFIAQRAEYQGITDVIGLTIGKASLHAFSSPPPVVIADRCTGCGVCVPACAFNAIYMANSPGGKGLAVIADNCISCNACAGVCPPKFNAIATKF